MSQPAISWENSAVKVEQLRTAYGEFPCRIVKKPRNKNTYLRIKEDHVLLTVGRYGTIKQAKALVQQNAAQIAAYLSREKRFYYLGNPLERVFEDMDGFYKQRAKAYLPPLVEKLSEQTGLLPAKVGVRKAKTRWGSCSAKNSISLSSYLMKLPPELIEYVIIHELAHIKHKNHSGAFWAEVQKHLPDYKGRVKQLRTFELKCR
jgi:predicted metal-dependent hydrolase